MILCFFLCLFVSFFPSFLLSFFPCLFVCFFSFFLGLFILFVLLSSSLIKSASAGTRTRISTLEGWNSALRPQMLTIYFSFQSSL